LEEHLIPLPLKGIGHLGAINTAAWSADGRLLATSGADVATIVWDYPSGRELHRFPGEAVGVDFSPDDQFLAASYFDRLEFFSLRDGKLTRRVVGDFWGPVRFTAGSPENAGAAGRTAWCCEGTAFVALEASTGRRLREVSLRLDVDAEYIRAAAISADCSTGAILANPRGQGRPILQIYDLSSGSLRLQRRPPQPQRWLEPDETGGFIQREEGFDEAYHLELSPDGAQLAAVAAECVWLCRSRNGRLIRILPSPFQTIPRHCRFSSDGRLLALASDGGESEVFLWRVRGGHVLFRITPGCRWVDALTFSPDSRTLLTGGSDKVARLWNADTGGLLRKLRAPEYSTTAVTWSGDGDRLEVTYTDGKCRTWNVREYLLEAIREASPFSDDGSSQNEACALSADGTVRAIARRGSGCKQLIEIHQDGVPQPAIAEHSRAWVNCLAFSSDSLLLAGGDYDNGVWVWSTVDGALLRWLYTPSPVGAVAFSAGRRFLAAGAEHSGDLWVWEVVEPDGIPGQREPAADRAYDVDLARTGHAAGIRGICFSPDDRHMATVGDDATVRLWDTATWTVQVTLLVLPNEQNAPSAEWVSVLREGDCRTGSLESE
jgi:WD40 repeat protein